MLQSLGDEREPAAILAQLRELGFERPTAIQAGTMGWIVAGRDVIAQSRTGSGKTLAYGLPLFQRLRVEQPPALQALLLCPTRELCAQVARELRRAGRRHPSLYVLTLTGGAPLAPQLAALGRGAHVVVGTPGRVLDHVRRGSLQLQSIAVLVLDEADRMLELGFAQDVEQLLERCNPARQTLLFSATYPRGIEALSQRYQREPVRVSVDEPADGALVTQRFVVSAAPHKPEQLQRLLLCYPESPALVFADQKRTVIQLQRALREAGFSADCLHGDMPQAERDLALAKFRNESSRVLVATDVAARGIDIAGLDLVINYDLPTRFDAYVHRIGRTGRAGRAGLAIAVVTPLERARVDAIAQALGFAVEPLSEPVLAERARAAAPPEPAAWTTLRIWGGRRNKLRPTDILGALTGPAVGLLGPQIGKIEIHERVAYVAVARECSRRAGRALAAAGIKGRRLRVDRIT